MDAQCENPEDDDEDDDWAIFHSGGSTSKSQAQPKPKAPVPGALSVELKANLVDLVYINEPTFPWSRLMPKDLVEKAESSWRYRSS